MAIQQLTQPIINPISAFDSTRVHTISFVVIGGAQVIGNRLVISDNETGEEIYNKIQSTMKLEHVIPANTLTNGGYYNAVVYTIDSANNESVASTPVPFYCYSQPSLTIDNIPATETIENGTYKFVGSYLQQENELLNSYQYTLYNSNKNILSQSALIYYDTDSSLSYTFVGMSNDTAYYIELSGETVNGTKITSGLKYFTVRYIQPASFAICDLVNNCEDGYIQISSNIVAIDGKSNPDPPIYIDDKEVDLRDPDSWVEWNSGFRIQDDFTMRVWGRDFNDYQNIITLTNDINTTSTPNRIELKWMVGDVIKTLPNYTTVEGKSINILDAEAAKIENLSIGGSLEQKTEDEIDFGTDKYLTINTDKSLPLQINVLGNSKQETRSGKNKLNFSEITTQTINGLTITNNKDGSIILNGTTTAAISMKLSNTMYNLVAGKYYLSRNSSGTVSDAFSNILFGNNGTAVNTGNLQSEGMSITTTTDYQEYYLWLYINSGITFTNYTMKPQLEEGTVKTDWELYGASPSPDYPSEVESCGDNVNLMSINSSGTSSGIEYSYNNGILTLNGTSTTGSGNYFDGTLTLKPGTYTISLYLNKTPGITLGYYLRDNENNSALVDSGNLSALTEKTINITLTEQKTLKSNVYIASGTSVDNLIIKIKIEEGSVSTPYTPYGQGCINEVICNKNLFDIERFNQYLSLLYKRNISSLIGIKNGFSFTSSGSDSYFSIPSSSRYLNLVSMKIEPLKTYYLSYISEGSNRIDKYLFYMDKNYEIIKSNVWLSDKNISSFTTPENAEYVFIRFGLPNQSGITVKITNIQLEENSTATQYEEHKSQTYTIPTQQPFRAIGDYRDTFVKVNGKWYERHYINRIVFDNNTTFMPGNPIYRYFYETNLNNLLNVSPICSHFKGMTDLNGNNIVVLQNNRVNFYSDKFANVTNFNSFIQQQYDAGTPVYLDYVLAEPLDIECTEEQSNVLDELNQLESYSPQTNIYTDDIALLNAKYLGLPTPYNPSKIYSLGDIKNLIDIPAFNIKYNQQYFQSTNTNFILKPNFIYTLSFDYNVNKTSTDLYYSIGYGTNGYDVDLKSNIQYQSLTKGRNSVSFIVPENIPNNVSLWVKFAQTIILADINVDISNIQLESGNISTDYEDPNLYNIYPTSASKNLFNYDSPVYLLKNNATYTPIQNGYNIKPTVANQDAYIGIGIKNVLNSGDIYTISFSQLGQFEKFNLYTTEKGNENIISEIPINNNSFVAPEGVYDLQLVFGVDSSNLSNYIEIWNIQIEANNVISEYEPYVSNSAVISLDEPLRGLGEYRDLICLESPNILNPETQSGIVKGNTTYYLNQSGDTQYYIWYYNEDGNLIKFIDTEGHEASGITGIKGSFTTHKDCVKITITKSSNPDSEDITADELKTNQVGITKGNNAQVYYPYVTEPSVIRYIQHRVFDGVNNNFIVKHGTIHTDTNGFYGLSLPGKILGRNGDIKYGICNYLKYIKIAFADQAVKSTGLWWEGSSLYNYASLPFASLTDANQWLVNLNNAKKPMTIDYVLKTPIVTSLSEDNISALKALSTYKPISNVFTNNEILGYLKLDYVSDYTEQQTQNAYVLLKCWNANSMPYICHSNYIDIPDEKDKVFIWMRRKNNLFDLKIENLGDYNEDDKPTDKTKPIVTLEINPNNVEATRIPVTAYSIDDNGLKTVRFSKDNGNTWDEIVNVDGLSATNSYIFINLNPNTTYTIRVEAIDLAGNIGGISQQVTTKSS